MSTILDAFKSYLTPDLIGKISAQLGEEATNVEKGAVGFGASILGGFASKAHDNSFMDSVFGLLKNHNMSDVLKDPAGLVHEGNLAHNDPKDVSGKVLGMIFGSKVPDVISNLGSYAGIKNSSSSHLLGVAGPMIMGLLSKKIFSDGLNAASLGRLLNSEKSSLLSFVPPSVINLFGWGTPATTTTTYSEPVQTGRKTNWLWPLLLLAALLFAFLYWKGCNNRSTDVVEPVVLDTVATVEAVPDGYNKKLSSGYELKGNLGGIEDSLVAFIESSRPVDKTTWFSFDRITFKTDSHELDMEKSQQQLNNISEILKAYPAVKLKIGGYTDNTGDESHNMELSQARAQSVYDALVAMGIDKDRLSPEGYGSQHPVADNSTEEGRAQNRRIDVRVMEK